MPLSAAEPERLSVYAPQARYSLPVVDLDGRQYVGIFELIEPLGAPELKADGARWKLRIPDSKSPGKTSEAEFQEGSAAAKVRGKKIALSSSARVENQRLMLPLHGIGAVLMPLLGTDLIFHEASRRMFLGGAAELISSELHKGESSTLALHFPQAVSPSISSDGNTLKLSFSRDPVISFTSNETLSDKLLTSSTFAENNGTATLTINGTAPLLAKFADDGKTIVIGAAPGPPAITATTPATPTPAGQPPAPEAGTPSATESSGSTLGQHSSQVPSFLVVIDPGHGGNDAGARITPTLPEKELTLALARKLRQELQARHIATMLLRDGDTDLSLNQRAVSTNLARPSIFITLHAEPGTALRIYTSALPSTIAAGATPDRNSFLPWQTAQAAFAADSKSLANAAAEALGKRELLVLVRPAFLEPLHAIAAPAIAVEVPAGAKGLKISEDLIAGALAEAVVARKSSSGSGQ